MILVCHRAFGNNEPGDEREVPDGVIYDRAYYHERDPKPDDGEDTSTSNQEGA